MNGVDKADQYAVYYSFIRKSRKWWRKLFFWLVEVTVINSYIMYKCSTRSPMTHLQYRRQLVVSLTTRCLQALPQRPRAGQPRKRPRLLPRDRDPERLNCQHHFLGKRTPHECVVCSKPGDRHRSIYFCKGCTSSPALCPDTCFERYHTLVDYHL